MVALSVGWGQRAADKSWDNVVSLYPVTIPECLTADVAVSCGLFYFLCFLPISVIVKLRLVCLPVVARAAVGVALLVVFPLVGFAP